MGGLLLDPAPVASGTTRTRIVVTGANGSVGKNLLAHAAAAGGVDVIAVVRSERAAASIRGLAGVDVRVVDSDQVAELARVMVGATSVVHLSGILIETRAATYEQANVAATRVAVEACREAKVPHLVLVSAIGADLGSPNRYRRSKAEGERIVEQAGLDATIIRTPILLGPDTAGAAALLRTATSGSAKLLGGGGYVMRPLDVDDLSRAILGVCRHRGAGVHLHELAGPEPLTYRALVERFAALMGTRVTLGSVPIWMAKLGATIKSRLSGGGVTATVIDVITANEHVTSNADGALDIRLTPLADTLAKILPARRATP